MRVLIVKTSSMGDVLHTLPALTDAQQAIPGIQFDWVVEEGFAQIPSWHAAVDRVIPVAIRRWRKAWFSAPIKAERKAFRDAVRLQQYDAIIDAQGLVKSAALVTRLACGVKHGMDWSTAREPLASLFYNRKHHIAKQQHAVLRKAAQQFRRNGQHKGGQYNAHGRAHPAQNHNREDQSRFKKGERGGVDKPLIGGKKHPGDTCRRCAQGEGREFDQNVV